MSRVNFFLYFDLSKTSRRHNVKIYLVDQRAPATVRNLISTAILSFLDNYVTQSTLVTLGRADRDTTFVSLKSNRLIFCSALFDCQSFTEYIYLSRTRRSAFFCTWLKFVSYESYSMRKCESNLVKK